MEWQNEYDKNRSPVDKVKDEGQQPNVLDLN